MLWRRRSGEEWILSGRGEEEMQERKIKREDRGKKKKENTGLADSAKEWVLQKYLNSRMELRQKSKQEENERRKVEDRRRRERENMAGLREALHLQNNRNNDKLDIQVSSKYVMVI